MKIIIHVGPDKTGSSAIQNWCNSNKNFLSEYGYYYPGHKIDSNKISSGNGQTIITLVNKNKKYCKESLKKLIKKAKDKDAKFLLISSEILWLFMNDIQKDFPETIFIFYLRLSVDYEESLYNQMIKRHGATAPFNNYNLQHRLFSIDFNNFNLAKIHFRFYGRDFFHNQEIISDFLYAIGINHLIGTSSASINTSYSFEALEFKRFLNFHTSLDSISLKRIDHLLQNFPNGNHSYTLTAHSEKKSRNKILMEKMDTFLKKYSIKIENHIAYKNYILNNKSDIFFEQKLGNHQFTEVSTYIKNQDTDLYTVIINNILSNSSKSFNNIYQDKNDANRVSSYKKLLPHVSTIYDMEKNYESSLLRDTALILENKNPDLALKIMKIAAELNPTGTFITKKLKSYQKIQYDKNPTFKKNKSLITTLKLKFLNKSKEKKP